MTADDAATPELKGPRESGLDTSSGLEFVQRRLALLAKITQRLENGRDRS